MEAMLRIIKNSIADVLEISGVLTMFISLIEVAQAFWFAAGGVAFLVGAIIKYLEYKNKKNDQPKG